MENKSEQRKQHKKNPHYAEQNYLHFLFLTVRRLKLISPTHDADGWVGLGRKKLDHAGHAPGARNSVSNDGDTPVVGCDRKKRTKNHFIISKPAGKENRKEKFTRTHSYINMRFTTRTFSILPANG